MRLRLLPHASAVVLFAALAACDNSSSAADPAADSKAKAKADEDAEAKARIEKRKQEREAKAAAEAQEKATVAKRIEEITVVPDGTKVPKKIAEVCELVVEAQRGFMKKFHPQIDDSMLTTQLGLLRKQCTDMNDPKVAMCQKLALDATDEQLKGSINEYLPVCMGKYGKK
jgi:hypothetical protein